MSEITNRPRLSDQAYLHTVRAGTLVPLSQAAISGTLAAAVVLTCAIWAGWSAWLPVTLLTWLLITGGTWVWLQRHWFALTLRAVETFTGLDINRDGIIGEDPARPAQIETHKIRLELTTPATADAGQQTTITDIDATRAQLYVLACGMLSDPPRPFSEREWSGNDKPFSPADFRKLQDVFLKRGIIVPKSAKDNRQGYKLTRAGRAVMEHFVTPYPTGENADILPTN